PRSPEELRADLLCSCRSEPPNGPPSSGAVRLYLPRGRWALSLSGPPLPWGGSPLPTAAPANSPCRAGPFGSPVTATGRTGAPGAPWPAPAPQDLPAGP